MTKDQPMKMKHNKKRNTAFLFEALVVELTRSIVSQDSKTKKVLTNIIKEHFSADQPLAKELECYKALSEEEGLDTYTAEKMIHRARNAYEKLSQSEIFQEQSAVISKINKMVGSQVFNNFVPQYKTFATIAQIFNEKTSLAQKVLMEKQIVRSLSDKTTPEPEMKSIDGLVVTKFVENFNNKYADLLPEQRELLNKYILALGDNKADFQVALMSELTRLHEEVEKSLTIPEVQSDSQMVESTKKVLDQIMSFDVATVAQEQIKKVLKIQKLVREYSSDATEN